MNKLEYHQIRRDYYHNLPDMEKGLLGYSQKEFSIIISVKHAMRDPLEIRHKNSLRTISRITKKKIYRKIKFKKTAKIPG